MNARRLALALAILLTLPALAAADSHSAVTWIAYSQVNSGMTQEAVEVTLMDKDFYDGLLADGTALSWGIMTPINHFPGEPTNHAVWVTLPSFAHVGKWSDAFFSHSMSRSEEEREELEKRFAEIFVAGSHWDAVHNSMHRVVGSGETPPRFLMIGSWSAKPGHDADVTALYMDLIPGVADPLVASGDLASYGMVMPALHGPDPYTHHGWYALSDLAAVDKLQAGIGQALAAMSAEKTARMWETMDAASHVDQIWMILHLGGTPGAGGAEAGGEAE